MTTESRPLVSIVIPVYNMEKYLRQCLDSVVCQTESNIEIICVDDGSSDSSLKILEEYQAKDSRFVVIKQENAGVAVARNVGVLSATGKYLFFADPDDELAPNLCQKTAEIADKYGSQILMTYSNGHLKALSKRFSQFRRLYDPKRLESECYENPSTERLRFLLYISGDSACWQFLYRRDFWIEQKIEFPKGIRIRADVDANYQALAKAERIALLEDELYYYRIREDSATRNNLGKRLGKRVDVFEAFRRTRDFYLKNAPSLLSTFIEIELYAWHRFSRGIIKEELQTLKKNVDSLFDDSVLQAIYQKDGLPFKARLFWLKFYGRSRRERIYASIWTRLFDDLFRMERFYKTIILPRIRKRKQEPFA